MFELENMENIRMRDIEHVRNIHHMGYLSKYSSDISFKNL